jgi:hypothetical protein
MLLGELIKHAVGPDMYPLAAVVIGVHCLVSSDVPVNSVSKLHVQVEPSATRVDWPPHDAVVGARVEVAVPLGADGMVASGADVEVVVVGFTTEVVVEVEVDGSVVCGVLPSPAGWVELVATRAFRVWDGSLAPSDASDRALLEGTVPKTVTSVNPPRSAGILHARGRAGTGLSV